MGPTMVPFPSVPLPTLPPRPTFFPTPRSGTRSWLSPHATLTSPSDLTTTSSTSTPLLTGLLPASAEATPPTSWLSTGARNPSTSAPTAGLTSFCSSPSQTALRIHLAVPTPRVPLGRPRPASSSGRPRVSTPQEPMELTSTPSAALLTASSWPPEMITVSLTSSATLSSRVSPDATEVTPSTSSALLSALMTATSSPLEVMIRPSCSGRSAEPTQSIPGQLG